MINRSQYCYCFSGTITIFFSVLLHTLASPTLHFCHHDQKAALLQFIDEFPIDESYSNLWNKSSDCCSWEGVTCDDKFGQVISLDLNNISLNSSLQTNSSLFRLQYLRHLDLNTCDLQGEIPSSLGNLSRLRFLDLSYNSLVGKIPTSIGNLNQLRNLNLGVNGLIGEIPFSLGNFSHLLELKIGDNQLEGEVPASIGNLKELRMMWLAKNNLRGNIPISFANFTKLSYFSIPSNHFTSTLPSDMSGFHSLDYFDVSKNSFLGPFPKSLFSTPLLRVVDLGENQFRGPVEFPNTSSSSSFTLQYLSLDNNHFSGPIPESISQFLNLEGLQVHDNNFGGSIPRSTSKLANLVYFDLSNNNLEGEVPGFLWRLSAMWLSCNSFSSFEKPSQETLVEDLKLRSNSFGGPFPPWICKLKELRLLDFSNNLFNGSIPPCLRTHNLVELNLKNNSFSGFFPDIFTNATELQSLDVSENKLKGKFPKSLISCKALRFVNVESNRFKDKFPSWLGSLPSLHVLSLRANEFYGPLYQRHAANAFQSLKIVDISHNGFTGTLPPYYFSGWREMISLTSEDDYMVNITTYSTIYQSIGIVNKGVELRFDRIRRDFRAIDFSRNKFYGKIPGSIGFLKELRLLNLSNNMFTSDIPRVLANLTKLESLDLSRNKLSGQIPQDLSKLSFLSYMNFSHNILQGPVPHGTQFQRQECSSFLDNPSLFGLKDICGETHVTNPTPSQQPEELLESDEQLFSWIVAAIAYGPGVICGLVIGHIFSSHKKEWFTKKYGRKKLKLTTRAH